MTKHFYRWSNISLAFLALAALVAFSLGCSFDVPENGVQLIVEQELNDDQMEILKVRLERMRDEGGMQSISSLTMNGITMINLSPVADVEAFSDGIDFGEVSNIEGRVVHLSVNVAQL